MNAERASAEIPSTVLASKIQSIGAYGFGTRSSPIEISTEETAAFLTAMAENKLLGTAIRAMMEEQLLFSEDGKQQLADRHDEAMSVAMGAECVAVRVSEILTNAGLAHRIIDGAAIAHTGYDDPALRSFEGVSILVQGPDIEDALGLLAVEGATRVTPEIRAGFDQRFAASIALTLEGVPVEIYRTLAPGRFGVDMKQSDLFVLRRVIRVAGVDMPVLDSTDSLLVACYRLALSSADPDLSTVRDVVLLAGSVGQRAFDAQRFEDSVDRWQARPVVRRAVRIVHDRLGECLPKELSWYADVWIDTGDREALAAYVIEDEDDRQTALEVTTFKALPMGDRPAFALAVGLSDGAEPVDRLKELFARRRS